MSTSGVHDNLFWPMLSTQTCTAFDILPLDGTSAAETHGVSAPWHGAATGECIPAAAYVLSLKTPIRGSAGRGRMFIGPIRETAQTDGFTDTTGRGNVVAGGANLQTALQAQSPVCELVVASYAHATANTVTSFRCDLPLGTQRRRQNQLR